MGLLGWISENGWSLFERACVAAGLFYTGWGLHRSAMEKRQENLLSLIEHHHEIVKDIRSDPALARVLQPNADASSVSIQEIHGVNALFLHLHSAFRASKARLYRMPENIDADIRGVLALPIPGAVWTKLKGSYNQDFVAFIDGIVGDKMKR